MEIAIGIFFLAILAGAFLLAVGILIFTLRRKRRRK
jgi:hypothetical protein